MIQTNLGGVARKAAGMLAVCSLVMVGAINQPVQADSDQPNMQGRSLRHQMMHAPTANSGKQNTAQLQSSSGETECVGNLSGTFESVVVPEGETCILSNSDVAENVTALDDSRLLATNNTVGASIRGNKHNVLEAFGNIVGENIQLQQGTGAGPGLTGNTFDHAICGNSLATGNISVQQNTGFVEVGSQFGCAGNTLEDGNIQVQQNLTVDPDALEVRNNDVTGDVDVRQNLGDGSKAVQGNVVSDRLRCEDNRPPFIGTPNTAGESEGQCAP